MRAGAFDLVLADNGDLADGVDGDGAADVDREGEMDAKRRAVGVGAGGGAGWTDPRGTAAACAIASQGAEDRG